MSLIKLPLNLQKKIRKFLYQRQKESTSELRRYFSKHEINQIAYKTKFVQRKSKNNKKTFSRQHGYQAKDFGKLNFQI